MPLQASAVSFWDGPATSRELMGNQLHQLQDLWLSVIKEVAWLGVHYPVLKMVYKHLFPGSHVQVKCLSFGLYRLCVFQAMRAGLEVYCNTFICRKIVWGLPALEFANHFHL